MKGIYILLIQIDKNISEKIGSLGIIKFDKGNYAYVGSAQNGLEKRIERHLVRNKKKFWHIDYLLSNKTAHIIKIFYKISEKSEECEIAKKLSETEIPIPYFGCSDCVCKSHFFKIKNMQNILKLGLTNYGDTYV